MNTILIAIAIKTAALTTFVPATCGAPRDIGGGQTVRVCEVRK